MCKALHEKILHILIAGRLFKEAYVVVKVCHNVFEDYEFALIYIVTDCVNFFYGQDNGDLISKPAIMKFATAYMKFGNINLINDVVKLIHGFGCKIDQVNNHGS